MSRWQLFPALADEEQSALRDSIADLGVLVPILVDDDGEILDGHHRKAIADELDVPCPVQNVGALSDDEKAERVLAANLARRHLSPAQRRDLVARLRTERRWSTRTIAEKVGVSQSQVVRDLETEPNGSVELPERIVSRDGRERPATGPRRVAPLPPNPEWRKNGIRSRWSESERTFVDLLRVDNTELARALPIGDREQALTVCNRVVQWIEEFEMACKELA